MLYMSKELEVQEDNVNLRVFSQQWFQLSVFFKYGLFLETNSHVNLAFEVINVLVFKAESICELLTYRMII